jgi:hypothetical protein
MILVLSAWTDFNQLSTVTVGSDMKENTAYWLMIRPSSEGGSKKLIKGSSLTDWVPRPKEEFAALHEAAIQGEAWVMEGNYSRLVPRRFERATGAILITSNSWLRLGRYFRRTLGPASSRFGALEGAPEYINWRMIDWIIFKTPANAKRYAKMIRATDLPAVFCNDRRALNELYRSWGLQRPHG